MKGFIEVHDDQGDENLVNIAHIVNVRGSIIYTDDSALLMPEIVLRRLPESVGGMITYTVQKEKGGRYYVADRDGHPIPGSYGDKHKAIRNAAKRDGITVKEYIKWRRER